MCVLQEQNPRVNFSRLASTLGIVFAFAVCLSLSGCGSGNASVTGRVTFNGDPVSRGSITLLPADGKGQPAGGNVENGSFSIREVLPGEKTVQIMAVYPIGREKRDDGSELEIVGDLLPAEWGLDSKHTLTVTAPTTNHDFPIEGPDPRK
jgi:hypothetical protein